MTRPLEQKIKSKISKIEYLISQRMIRERQYVADCQAAGFLLWEIRNTEKYEEFQKAHQGLVEVWRTNQNLYHKLTGDWYTNTQKYTDLTAHILGRCEECFQIDLSHLRDCSQSRMQVLQCRIKQLVEAALSGEGFDKLRDLMK